MALASACLLLLAVGSLLYDILKGTAPFLAPLACTYAIYACFGQRRRETLSAVKTLTLYEEKYAFLLSL